jgi:hypothetical protein
MFERNYLERIEADELLKKLIALDESTQKTKDYIGNIHNNRYKVLCKLENSNYCQFYKVEDLNDEKIMSVNLSMHLLFYLKQFKIYLNSYLIK